ncbi:23967_t:CDS:2, partial [Gigaspora margarita]
HTLYPSIGPEIQQQIQEIAVDYSCQLCYPVARNITIHLPIYKFELDTFIVLYTQNTTTAVAKNSDSDSDLELDRLFQTLLPNTY